jgi:hypothetical protein
VIQTAQPWISNHDIPSGSRWSLHLGEQLQELKTGILCLTPDNLSAPWILFEAGALSKALGDSLVCPYLFKVEPIAVEWPLGQFQLETADKEGTRKLLATINNAATDGKLESGRLQESFDMWWPRLEEKLAAIKPVPSAVPRPARDLLVEILNIVRQLSRDTPVSLVPGTGLLSLVPSFGRAVDSSAATGEEMTPELEALKKRLMDVAREEFRQNLLKQAENQRRTGKDKKIRR